MRLFLYSSILTVCSLSACNNSSDTPHNSPDSQEMDSFFNDNNIDTQNTEDNITALSSQNPKENRFQDKEFDEASNLYDPPNPVQEKTSTLSQNTEKPSAKKPPIKLPPEPKSYKKIEWTDLMPKEDIEALMNPPSYVTDVEDGSEEDVIRSQLQNNGAGDVKDPYQQALISTSIVPEMDNQAIRLPGFVVPLEFDGEQTITQFFLVPFFGACIHLPPPPPNQIILVDYPQGMKLDALYDPFWVSGIIKVDLTENDTATAAYSMIMYQFEKYVE